MARLYRLICVGLFITLLGCIQTKEYAVNNEINVIEPKGKIAFNSLRDGNFEIYVMDANGENVERLTNHDSIDYGTSWSADGGRLAFYSKRSGNTEIYTMNLDGSGLRQITNNTVGDVLPDWSHSGKQIVFVSTREEESDRKGSGREIYIMNSDGSGERRLTDNDVFEESPHWSPDDSKIAFTRHVPDPDDTLDFNAEIFVMNPDGSNVQQLTHRKGFDSGAVWSHDGKRIAFYGEQDGYFDIFIMNTNGSDLVNITNDSIEDYTPSWSSDNQWISFTRGNSENYDIWIIHVATGEKRRLTTQLTRDQSSSWRPKINR